MHKFKPAPVFENLLGLTYLISKFALSEVQVMVSVSVTEKLYNEMAVVVSSLIGVTWWVVRGLGLNTGA